MTTTETSPEELEAQIGAYAERLFGTGLAAFEATIIALGRQLGLYPALAERGPSTAAELAEATAIDPRYAREWLEQQAVAGWIDVAGDAGEDPEHRRYALSPAGQECLLRPESLASVGPLFDFVAAVGPILPAVADAFRTGGGVPYADYGIHDAQGDFNRPVFVNLLTTEWLPALPGFAERLASAAPPAVVEIGCGEGWAAIAIATAWPNVRVDAYDLDDASIAAARQHATDAGVSDRVRFEVADVTNPDAFPADAYDLVLAFEMIHDLARPQQALATMRRMGTADAAYLVVDERVAEQFEAPTENPIERLFYAASVLHCLPVGMADKPSAGTGTVMRPDTLRRYATDAGFTDLDVLPIEHDLFRLYRLVA
jgi:SAM-dependent methyltransferase